MKCVALLLILSALATPATEKFSRLLTLAFEQGQLSVQEIQYLIDSPMPLNPLLEAGPDRSKSHAFESGFDLLLNGEDEIDWNQVKEVARELLGEKAEKQEERDRATVETKNLPKPELVKSFNTQFRAPPVTFESNGERFVLAPTFDGLFVAALPNFKFKYEIGNRLRVNQQPIVFTRDGRLRAAVFEGDNDAVSIYDLEDRKAAPSTIRVPALPWSAPAPFKWAGKNFAAFASETPGLTVVNLDDGTAEIIKFGGQAASEPKVYFEGGVPFTLVSTRSGLWSLNLKTKKPVKQFKEAGDIRYASAGLYEKDGQNFAIAGAEDKTIFINLSESKVIKELPALRDEPRTPVVFDFQGQPFAALEFKTSKLGVMKHQTGVEIFDLETGGLMHSRKLVDTFYGVHSGVHAAYSDLGYPYVLFHSPDRKIHVLDPLTGRVLFQLEARQSSNAPELVFTHGGGVYYMVGSNSETQVFKLFGPVAAQAVEAEK